MKSKLTGLLHGIVFAIFLVIFCSGCDDDGRARSKSRHAIDLALANESDIAELDSKVHALCLAASLPSTPDIRLVPTDLAPLTSRVALLESKLQAQSKLIAQLSNFRDPRLAALSLDEDGSWCLTDVNLMVKSELPGRGNIVIGTNDVASFKRAWSREPLRTGTGCLVVGGSHEYTGKGAIVGGIMNSSTGDNSVLFGCENRAEGTLSSCLGGTWNASHGKFSVVAGGERRTAAGSFEFKANDIKRPGSRR